MCSLQLSIKYHSLQEYGIAQEKILKIIGKINSLHCIKNASIKKKDGLYY